MSCAQTAASILVRIQIPFTIEFEFEFAFALEFPMHFFDDDISKSMRNNDRNLKR